MVEFENSVLFQYIITFWLNSILFQGLENRLTIQHFFNTMWEPCLYLKSISIDCFEITLAHFEASRFIPRL